MWSISWLCLAALGHSSKLLSQEGRASRSRSLRLLGSFGPALGPDAKNGVLVMGKALGPQALSIIETQSPGTQWPGAFCRIQSDLFLASAGFGFTDRAVGMYGSPTGGLHHGP